MEESRKAGFKHGSRPTKDIRSCEERRDEEKPASNTEAGLHKNYARKIKI